MNKDKKLLWIYILSMLIYFGQGIGKLPALSLFIYLKDVLKFEPSTIMYIGSITGIAWVCKPLWGFLIDNFFSKIKWILFSVIGSILVSFYFGLSSFIPLVVLIILLTLADLTTAVRDVSCDGIMCETGKELDVCDKIQSLQWIAITIASIFVSLGGGYIAQHYSYQSGYLCLIPFYLILLACTVKYKRIVGDKIAERKENLFDTIKSYKVLFTDKRFATACLFLLLYKFSPSFGVPLSYIELDVFKWSPQFIGILGAITSVFEIGGAILFYKYCKKINVKRWLYISVFAGALTSLCYLYFTPVTAISYGIMFSVIGMWVHLIIMSVMASSTVDGKEATSFALLCSISNLSTGTISSVSGAYLLPKVGLNWLIIISAITSLLCLPLIKKLDLKEHKA